MALFLNHRAESHEAIMDDHRKAANKCTTRIFKKSSTVVAK